MWYSTKSKLNSSYKIVYFVLSSSIVHKNYRIKKINGTLICENRVLDLRFCSSAKTICTDIGHKNHRKITNGNHNCESKLLDLRCCSCMKAIRTI